MPVDPAIPPESRAKLPSIDARTGGIAPSLIEMYSAEPITTEHSEFRE